VTQAPNAKCRERPTGHRSPDQPKLPGSGWCWLNRSRPPST